MLYLLWITVWLFLNKLNIELHYDPANTLPKRNENRDSDTCLPMFTATSLTITKGRNNPNVHGCMSGLLRMYYIHTKEYYSGTERNEVWTQGTDNANET